MKLVTAIIKPFKLDEVREALSAIGVTKDIGGYVFGAAYVDSNAKGDCGTGQFYCFLNGVGTKTQDAGSSTVVISVSKSF